jgi:hypothetical protein
MMMIKENLKMSPRSSNLKKTKIYFLLHKEIKHTKRKLKSSNMEL